MPKLCVIGLDGLGLEHAEALARMGVMPRLGSLLEKGRAFAMRSTLPDLSPVCWGSLFSGRQPGGHGVYGFAGFRPGGYQVEPVSSLSFQAPRIWQVATQRGLRSVVLGVPLTYPAEPINGIMVSGFVCPELAGGVHPKELLERLKLRSYRPEADLDLAGSDEAALLRDLKQALEIRIETFAGLMEGDWDLLIAVITDTDRVNHFFWPALWDSNHPLSREALDIYRISDRFIDIIWKRLGPAVEAGDAGLLICADHSFGPIEQEVYLNPWLESQGYLKTAGPVMEKEILAGTRAMALDPGRIYLNWAHRFPRGGVKPGPEAASLVNEIKTSLEGMRLPPGVSGAGLKPVAKVHLGREIYSGPFTAQAPDLVAEAAPGISLRAGMAKKSVFGRSHLTGTHRPDGAMGLWLGPDPGRPLPENITGLYEIMACALGLNRPLA